MLIVASTAAGATTVRVIALFTDKALLEVDGQQKVVSKGETFSGVFLQSASGRGAVVVIEGETKELDLNQSIAGNFKKRDKIKLRIVPDARGMYFAKGTINGKSTGFLVDTGATHVTISGRKAENLNIDFKKGVRSRAQTAAAVVPVWQVTLDTVEVGGIKLNNVSATVIEGDHPSEVLLGNSFLRHTQIVQSGSILEISKRF
ncbi:MAG: clan AA aspartic protease [Gammaproteobacteria bacterium]|nr:clan AA aspartic protease [Gammaproteobacteria bacterium]